MRRRIKGVKVVSSNNILAARKVYIDLTKKIIPNIFKHKYYIEFFGKRKEISYEEAKEHNFIGVCIE